MKQILHRIALLAILLSGSAAHTAELEINVQHTFNGDPLLLDSLRYQNAAGETISVTRLSYLLSDFALERPEGGWVEIPNQQAWMDAATQRNRLRLVDVPEGKFRALRFSIGLDPKSNASDAAQWPAEHPLNPALNGLHWSWQGGYIFLALEGHFRAGSDEMSGYALHLARDPNQTRISLSMALDLKQEAALLLGFDVGTLINSPRILSFSKDGSTTHSRKDDPIAAMLVTNLPGAFRLQQIATPASARISGPPVQPIDLPEKYTPYPFTMSRTFPLPDLPRDNPLIIERVALGERLFHEKGLSRDGSISCATCHQAEAAFTDRLPVSKGIEGRLSKRNAMPLFNLAWKTSFFWDGRAPSLRSQALMPIQDHLEMDETLEHVTAKLAADTAYAPLFKAAFGSSGITSEKLGLSLEQYLLTITSFDSKFDRALNGRDKFTDEEARGFELFMTESDLRTEQRGADCFHCHGGPLFSDHQFHNNGLKLSGPGRAEITKLRGDEGKFATPSLRNVALTAPYMHDGRFTTLEEVVDHYRTGIQHSPTLDPNLAKHTGGGIPLSDADRSALVAFLRTLTELQDGQGK